VYTKVLLFLPYVENTQNSTKEEEHYYSEIFLSQTHCDDTIKMDSNPSYESYTGQGSNVAVESNLSNGVTKTNQKTTESQYDYPRPTDLTKHMHQSHYDRESYVHMESNPSYGVATRMGTKATPGSDPVHGCVETKK